LHIIYLVHVSFKRACHSKKNKKQKRLHKRVKIQQ